ncbi:hypothetical protein [Imbroritus primus]|jgi:hypothetical protein|uniref:hypothetical protein n=1 Tax=Imbroritus primus TaxID=3058603 RepID=UPI003D160645
MRRAPSALLTLPFAPAASRRRAVRRARFEAGLSAVFLVVTSLLLVTPAQANPFDAIPWTVTRTRHNQQDQDRVREQIERMEARARADERLSGARRGGFDDRRDDRREERRGNDVGNNFRNDSGDSRGYDQPRGRGRDR